MTLRDYIVALGLKGTPEQIAEALNTRSIPVHSSAPYTGSGLADELGPDLTRQVLFGIETAMQNDPLVRALYNELTSTGIDFSHPMVQQMIDEMHRAGFFSKEAASRLKQIGINHVSPYEQFAGDGAVVTPDQVKEALQDIDAGEVRVTLQGYVRERSRSLEIIVDVIARTSDEAEEVISRRRFHITDDETTGDEDIDELVRDIVSDVHDYIRMVR